MDEETTVILFAALFAGGLLVGLILCMEAGRRWELRQLQRDPEGARTGTGAVEGAVFALLGLLIAFTFSGAATRFDMRRQLIVQEANAIGTAWLRIDVLPAQTQPALRELFRQYVDSRLAAYRLLPDMEAARAELDRSVEIQGRIWQGSVAAASASPTPAAMTVMVPALNEMIDIVTTRTATSHMHPPLAIYGLLFVLALLSALFAGSAMAGNARRSTLHVVGFAVIMALSVYLILDLEYPRFGWVRVDAADQLLVDVRASFDRGYGEVR
jgi:hypothetical protein